LSAIPTTWSPPSRPAAERPGPDGRDDPNRVCARRSRKAMRRAQRQFRRTRRREHIAVLVMPAATGRRPVGRIETRSARGRRNGDPEALPTVGDVRRRPIDRRSGGAGPTMRGGERPAAPRTKVAERVPGEGGTTNRTVRGRAGKHDIRLHHEATMSKSLDHHEDERPRNGEDHRRVIAIDGPAAAGKTTVARALADRLGATYLDTGLLYRAVTLSALRAGIAPTDGDAIARLARNSRFKILPPPTPDRIEEIMVDGEVVTPALRTAEIDRHVSAVSAHPDVRATLLPIQRRIATDGTVVMVGRDITTVVIPDAGVKVFLNASPAERARRRLTEIEAIGRNGTFDEMLREIERRDHADSTRATAPLRAGDNVTVVETDGRTVSDIVDEIAALAERTWRDDPMAVRVAGER
jgi:cytidylate kinase